MTRTVREHIRRERSRIMSEQFPWCPDTWLVGTANAAKAAPGSGRDRAKVLAAKRAWWHRNRGTGKRMGDVVSATPAENPDGGWGEHPWMRRAA